ncbi:MAG: SDR family NAD(P)-dependent oxidoreductase [Lysobacteraceae bacterium]
MADINEVFIVTGCSRGLGAALCQQAQRLDRLLLGMARQPCTESLLGESVNGSGRETWRVDLGNAAAVAERLGDWLLQGDQANARRWVLINNAAVLETPRDLSGQAASHIEAVLRVGLEAPMLLSSALLAARDARHRAGHAPSVQIMNISSGLGRRAMAGTAAYCAAKAGLDHFARVLALEESAKPLGARVVSIAPGVIDTSMQRQLRGASPAEFAAQKDFSNLHSSGSLSTPETTAMQLLAWLERPDFGQQVVCDVRQP